MRMKRMSCFGLQGHALNIVVWEYCAIKFRLNSCLQQQIVMNDLEDKNNLNFSKRLA